MNRELKPGSRVRLTKASKVQPSHPGDTGTVLHGPYSSGMGGPYYVVQMDKADRPVAFLPEEVEAIKSTQP